MRAVLAFLLAFGWAMNSAAAPAPDLARGEHLARLHCGGCHAVGATGASANRAAPPFRELNKRYRIDDLAQALSGGLLEGHPAMPRLHFAQPDTDAVLAYLKSIQTAQAAAGASPPRR